MSANLYPDYDVSRSLTDRGRWWCMRRCQLKLDVLLLLCACTCVYFAGVFKYNLTTFPHLFHTPAT